MFGPSQGDLRFSFALLIGALALAGACADDHRPHPMEPVALDFELLGSVELEPEVPADMEVVSYAFWIEHRGEFVRQGVRTLDQLNEEGLLDLHGFSECTQYTVALTAFGENGVAVCAGVEAFAIYAGQVTEQPVVLDCETSED